MSESIMKTYAIIAMACLLILLLFAWAPWLNDQTIQDKVLQEKGKTDGTIDKDGNPICGYKVSWLPFGRYAASC